MTPERPAEDERPAPAPNVGNQLHEDIVEGRLDLVVLRQLIADEEREEAARAKWSGR